MGKTCTISKNLQHTNSLWLSCAVFPSLGRLLNQQVQCEWNSVASQPSLFLSSISYKDVFETFKPKWKSQNQVSSAEVSSNIRPDQLGLFHFPLFKLCAFCIFLIVDDDPLKSYDWQWDTKSYYKTHSQCVSGIFVPFFIVFSSEQWTNEQWTYFLNTSYFTTPGCMKRTSRGILRNFIFSCFFFLHYFLQQ